MVDLARAYCEFVEHGTRSRKKFLSQIGDLLPQLFAAAMDLPYASCSQRIWKELGFVRELDAPSSSLTPANRRIAEQSRYRETRVSTDGFFRIIRRLNGILADKDDYFQVFNPTEKRSPMVMLLSNDLAEIWRDVKCNLLLMEVDEEAARKHAVFDWAHNVRIHWGCSHFCDAMKVIFYIYEDDDWQNRAFVPSKLRR